MAQGGERRSTAPEARNSAGVRKVPSLLFNLELEDGVDDSKPLDEDLEEVLDTVRSLTNPWTPTEQQLRRQVHEAYADALNKGLKPEAHFLAKKLHLRGFTFQIRSALGGGSGTGDSCLQQLKHFFVTCSATGVSGAATYVIDPCFREQFEIANPTVQYSTVLSEVPREFVGTEERVTQLVELLSGELKKSFQATGSTLPPWRHSSSILSKWKPRRSLDTPVPSSAASEAGPAQQSFFTKAASVGEGSKVSVTASSSVNDVASTMAEFGGAKKPAVPSARVMASSPTIGVPIHKRGRGHASSSSISTCSSLLAVKLRGVVTQHRNAAEAYMALCPSHSRA